MSMLRRPLTQLNLCMDDVEEMVDEMHRKLKFIVEAKRRAYESSEEPMDLTSRRSSSTNSSNSSKKSFLFVRGERTSDESEGSASPVASSSSGGSSSAVDMTTPVNAEAAMPPQNLRMTRAQARRQHLHGFATPSHDLRFEPLPESPEDEEEQERGNNSDRSVETSSSESPNAHVFATPAPVTRRPPGEPPVDRPSSNLRRSQRH